MTDAVLTVNAGSSSLKLALFEIGAKELLPRLQGAVDHLDSAPWFRMRDQSGAELVDRGWPDPQPGFEPVLTTVLEWIETHLGEDTLVAVGHRVVHGGPDYHLPMMASPDLIASLKKLTPLAPLHQQHNLAPICAIALLRPRLPQIVCFDTAFHHTLPPLAVRFALPRHFHDAGVRRYGFHGLSYEYISRRLRELEPELVKGRVIVAHLGNGASLCAMKNGCSVETTMGFTALDGLVMGTRSGSLDPGVVLYLQQSCGLDCAAIEDLLYRRSGLLGVSGGLSSDMRELLASQDPLAKEAVDLFVYRIVHDVGALMNVLGGLDGLIFTAGIGEHAPTIRKKVCAGLEWLGAVLDDEANTAGARIISSPASAIRLGVLATDEEAMIADHVVAMLRP